MDVITVEELNGSSDIDTALRGIVGTGLVRVRVAGAEQWGVGDPGLCRRLLTDPRLSSARPDGPSAIMIGEDDPQHALHRRAVGAAFGARAVRLLEGSVRRITDELLDRWGPAGETDALTSFAHALPLEVICELLGVPLDDRETFRGWANDMIGPDVPVRQAALGELDAYMLRLVRGKQAAPGADLLGDLLADRSEGALSVDEVARTGSILLIAGHETTGNLIANTLLALLDRPAQLALVREDPARVPDLVEEGLRHASPVANTPSRVALADIELDGVTIHEGELVTFLLAAANRAPALRDDPDLFDLTRPAPGHLAFGHGAHFCLGQRLARLEASVAFTKLLARYPRLELAVDRSELRWRPSPAVHGLVSLPVRYGS